MKDNDFSTAQLIIRDIAEHEPDDNPEALHISVKALELVLTKHIEPLRDRKNSIVHLQGRESQLQRALGGMLFAFDDGVGRSWSADLLDFARTLTPATEFTADRRRPLRFADLPPQLPEGETQVELLRDALDHIAKTCHQSRQQSRRIRWIEARANSALEGKQYDEKLLDLPVEVDREIDRFKRRDRRQLTRIKELEDLLREAQSYTAADPDDDVWPRIDAALSREPVEPETCTWSQHEFSWSSTCGVDSWEFTDGGTPAENGMKFCHCCGKTLVVECEGDE